MHLIGKGYRYYIYSFLDAFSIGQSIYSRSIGHLMPVSVIVYRIYDKNDWEIFACANSAVANFLCAFYSITHPIRDIL
jgi:hypothetical protein